MRWITAQDISEWARVKQRDCQEKFPWLIGSLIRATTPNIKEFDFPSGDNISLQGWDGRLKCKSVCPFVPDGLSGWEFGTTGQSITGKADEDYGKRSKEPSGFVPNKTTFVFATPRPWPQRHKWCDGKKASGAWKDVRVVGAVELEEWLALAPAVAAELARHIGKFSGEIESIQAFSDGWLTSTKKPISAKILLAGRTVQSEQVRKWGAGAPDILEIKDAPVAESLAFVWASLDQSEPSLRQAFFSRAIIVRDEAALKAAIPSPSPLIIFIPALLADLAGEALQHGHHVCIVGSPNVNEGPHDLQLPRSSREDFIEALVDVGISKDDASGIAKVTGGGIPELKRYWALTDAQRNPQWAATENVQNVIPAILMGGWSGNDSVSDHEIAEKLSGSSLSQWQGNLRAFSAGDDVLIQNVGEVWKLSAQPDALMCCARHINRERLNVFGVSVVDVLTEVHPKYELDADKRYAHSVYGVDKKYSSWLRKSMAGTVCLIGARGNEIGLDPALQSEGWAGGVVRRVLEVAETWQAWASLKDVLPLLAEASPSEFLASLEEKLDAFPDQFIELMKDDGAGFGTECLHSGLLWALEIISWLPEYIIPATKIIARLADLDPGGNYANRPQASLTDIFTISPIHTAAKSVDKLAAMDALIASHPSIAWNILHQYSSARGFTTGTVEPAWRSVDVNLSNKDVQDYAAGLLDRYVELIIADVGRLAKFIEDGFPLRGKARAKIVGELQNIDYATWEEKDRTVLFHGIRKRLNYLRSYEDPGEARDSEISLLDGIYTQVTPDSVEDRYGWLFDEAPPALPEGEKRDYKKFTKHVEGQRDRAVSLIFAAIGVKGIEEFCSHVGYPKTFVMALGRVIDAGDDKDVTTSLLELIGDDYPHLIEAYSFSRISTDGDEWLASALQEIENSPEKAIWSAALCLGLRQNQKSWKFIDDLGADVAAQYWKWISPWPDGRSAEEISFAMGKLLEAGRPLPASDIADLSDDPLPGETVLATLEAIATAKHDPQELRHRSSLGYHIERLFNRLDESGVCSSAEISQLEWPMFKLLENTERGPRAIYETLRQNPGDFTHLVSWVFKRDEGDDAENGGGDDGLSEEQRKIRAENALDILSSWNSPPGVEGGNVDGDALLKWVDEARRLCRENGRSYGGDYFIAKLLIHVPPHWLKASVGEVWPHEGVQSVIEKHGNPKFDREFIVAVHNSRGTVWRGRGGNQERDLADKFNTWADAVPKTSWRTGQILRELARSYEADARWHDEQQKLDDMRYD